jgi:aminopeptidase N
MKGERPAPILTQEEAEARAASVKSNLLYRIFVDFRQGENYSGLVRIEFRLNNKDNVFVDYAGDSVDAVILNGNQDEAKAENGRINLNPDFLNVDGINILHIKFSNRYYTDGNGVQTYTDVDGSQYLYTQSEPYWGNRVMPLFDQPDLKAQYILHAASPADWKVITSVPCEYTSTWSDFVAGGYGSDYYRLLREHFPEIPEGHLWWQFGSTVPLSTYLQNIVCGPYEVIDLPTEKRYRGIPMAIYCRKSLLEYAQQESHNIFEFNMKGIEYYEGLFNLDYPFGKLDTIFCPEYTVGAMEYPGAVTYTERLLPKNKNTTNMISLRGSVILHELAHMWFGNAVTMRWWNGLWLNESFADFVCYMAWAGIREKLDFETYDAWLRFMTRKGWGYKEDQECTTHQIAAEVANTQVADNIFDGITYSKHFQIHF